MLLYDYNAVVLGQFVCDTDDNYVCLSYDKHIISQWHNPVLFSDSDRELDESHVFTQAREPAVSSHHFYEKSRNTICECLAVLLSNLLNWHLTCWDR